MAKFYAIKEGYDSFNKKKVENIIVDTWDECLKYVKGVKGAKYKSFKNLEEARNFFDNSSSGFKKSDKTYPKDCLHIYVDGSYSIETEEYSYGVVAVENEVVLYIESGKGKAKNIRQIAGELKGAIRGVEYAFKTNRKKVVIFHDYMGICYHATGFWSRNGESSKRYYEKMQKFIKKGMEIIFVKVDSHTGDLFNELVDEKCKEVLKIDSDKVVEKWLKNKEIKVISDKVKEQILSIAPKGEENIKIVSEDIIKYKDSIKKYINDEKVMLVTGNSIVLFANCLKDENDSTIFNGLGIINSDARVSSKRIVCESLFKSEGLRDDIIGFQNRGFYLDTLKDDDKLFDVVSGVGVNKNLNIEGMNKNNFYATFLIGPILVRNPEMLNCFVNLILKDEKFVKLDFAKEAYEKFKALYYGKN